MKITKITSTAMVLAFAAVLGFTGLADARPHMGYQNMSPEQYKAMQDTYAEFDKRVAPLRQQLYAKQTELNTLYGQGAPQNDSKVQALSKDIGNLDNQLYAAHTDLRGQLSDRGVPAYGGMGYGYGCSMSGPGYDGMMSQGYDNGMMNHGRAGGAMGRGMMSHGGCGW